jgi:hypothetical protein
MCLPPAPQDRRVLVDVEAYYHGMSAVEHAIQVTHSRLVYNTSRVTKVCSSGHQVCRHPRATILCITLPFGIVQNTLLSGRIKTVTALIPQLLAHHILVVDECCGVLGVLSVPKVHHHPQSIPGTGRGQLAAPRHFGYRGHPVLSAVCCLLLTSAVCGLLRLLSAIYCLLSTSSSAHFSFCCLSAVLLLMLLSPVHDPRLKKKNLSISFCRGRIKCNA